MVQNPVLLIDSPGFNMNVSYQDNTTELTCYYFMYMDMHVPTVIVVKNLRNLYILPDVQLHGCELDCHQVCHSTTNC